MWRGILIALGSLALCGFAMAEPQVRGMAAASSIQDGWFGRTDLRLGLSAPVAHRVYVVEAPPRLVVDLKGVDLSGLSAKALLAKTGRAERARLGQVRGGWGRLVVWLSEPMLPDAVAITAEDGASVLQVRLQRADKARFARQAARARWAGAADMPPVPGPEPSAGAAADGALVVVIDPGHGGVDPGAVHDGIYEKDLMLTLAEALRGALERAGIFEVHLTRARDRFVSLPERVDHAHAVGADLFLSLHADAIAEGTARGATVYTLSEEASSRAAARLAAEHDRTGIITGLDLEGQEGAVVSALSSLARQETAPRTEAFAALLVERIKAAGLPMHVKPRQSAAFSVLQSPDIPSVLLEVGFMSDARDLADLRDPLWRQRLAQIITEAVVIWAKRDAGHKDPVGQ